MSVGSLAGQCLAAAHGWATQLAAAAGSGSRDSLADRQLMVRQLCYLGRVQMGTNA